MIMRSIVRYLLGMTPGLIIIIVILLEPRAQSMYDFGAPTTQRLLTPALLLLTATAYLLSIPVVIYEIRKLIKGQNIYIAATSLVFSVPVFILGTLLVIGAFLK